MFAQLLRGGPAANGHGTYVVESKVVNDRHGRQFSVMPLAQIDRVPKGTRGMLDIT
jgi:hypothetical protein